VVPALAPVSLAISFGAISLGAIGEGGNFVALFTASAVFAALGANRPVRSVR
jgi:flagellar motor component MotA